MRLERGRFHDLLQLLLWILGHRCRFERLRRLQKDGFLQKYKRDWKLVMGRGELTIDETFVLHRGIKKGSLPGTPGKAES